MAIATLDDGYNFQFLIKGYLDGDELSIHGENFQFLIKGYWKMAHILASQAKTTFNSSLKDTQERDLL